MDYKKTYIIATLGCKLNQYDSGKVAGLMRKKGLMPYSSSDGGPDVTIVNTCIVTAEGERKSRQAIRRMRIKYPRALLAVIGCYPQMYSYGVMNIEGVDIYAGTTGHDALVDKMILMLGIRDSGGGEGDGYESNDDIGSEDDDIGGGDDMGGDERVRAYVKIQEGCDNYCNYCVVPYVRGRARSRELTDIMDEVDSVLLRGAPEIVLTGTHISSYKTKTTSNVDQTDIHANTSSNVLILYSIGSEITLGELVDIISRRLRRENRNMRLRLSSLEPAGITPDFVSIISTNRDMVCPHFHLSLQSGSADILRLMNRRYTPDEYKKAVALLRGAFPDAAITTDIITGFPGESEDDFHATMDFCREIAFAKIHVFPYSNRPKTRAMELTNKISPQIKRERAKRLIALSEEMSLAFNSRYVGQDVQILVERNANGIYEGLTANYIRVRASDLRATDKRAPDTHESKKRISDTCVLNMRAYGINNGASCCSQRLIPRCAFATAHITEASASGLYGNIKTK